MSAGVENFSPTLPISSAPPVPLNSYPSQTNQLVAPPFNPAMNVPSLVNLTALLGYGSASPSGLLPNYGTTYTPPSLPTSTVPTIRNHIHHAPQPHATSLNTSDILANVREEMSRVF